MTRFKNWLWRFNEKVANETGKEGLMVEEGVEGISSICFFKYWLKFISLFHVPTCCQAGIDANMYIHSL